MSVVATEHDHDGQVAQFGECITCATMPEVEREGTPAAPDFDGATYERPLDQYRLAGQLGRVLGVMSDGQWRTLAELATATGDPEASVSARLRDLRKPRFGQLVVDARRRGDPTSGHWEYAVRPADG